MENHIDLAIKRLNSISKKNLLTEGDANFLYETIDNYFGVFQRNQKFSEVEKKISPKFGEFLNFFGAEKGLRFATNYFLFAYTLAKNYRECQIEIEEQIAQPFKDWVEREWGLYSGNVKTIPMGEEFVFFCRHATAQGMYAPGKATYTFSKALLEHNHSVTLIILGDLDDKFKVLARRFPKLTLATLTLEKNVERFEALVSLLVQLRPRVVLTEIEFDLASVLSILGPSIPVMLLSSGYYNLPWYDKIGLTDTLSDNPVGNRTSDHFVVPAYVTNELLRIPLEPEIIERARDVLGIAKQDIVIGSFARMEKFSDEFANVLLAVLERTKNTKILIAGPNDSSLVVRSFKKHFKDQRALVLGESDTQILGNCVDIGLDTFPTHSGFSMLELMAKGVPVVSKNDEGIDGYWRHRLPGLLCSSDEEVIDRLCELSDDEKLRTKFSLQTSEFIDAQERDAAFVSAVHEALVA